MIAVAVAVGHVAAEDHLAFIDQIQNVGQDFIFDFGAEVDIAALINGYLKRPNSPGEILTDELAEII